ncbi:carbohydrate kinase family protein [Pseudomonas syringae]|uniref:carbohydrate kinase family protein n=1 Tax=Pseudomonas syringae TaxID=317 RepID=UPI0006E543E7|nr:carbohydrate kinase [Pseudomonas syringae]KPY45356.1 putative fructokinase [Pseudomonas syringae pv. rhaphiolepidis]KWS45749.1 sugar kinase [Pseudomonas syringae pv. rhaphiolepidis]
MGLPMVVVFGEALTDIVQHAPGQWSGHPGGAPWNVARALSRLGVPTAFAGSISTDSLGDEIARQSREAGLDTAFIQRVETDPLVAVVPSSRPPRYFFAGEADLAFDPMQLPMGWLEAAKLCHFSCISLAREPLATRLLEIARNARSAGKLISYDPNWRNVMGEDYRQHTFPAMVALADIIKLSDEDLRHLYPGHAEAQALIELRGLNPSADILFTRGERGMVLHTPSGCYEQSAIVVDVIDTVGAGDASMAGYLAGDWLSISSAHERLRLSAACASVSCTRQGAYAPAASEVQALLRAIAQPQAPGPAKTSRAVQA